MKMIETTMTIEITMKIEIIEEIIAITAKIVKIIMKIKIIKGIIAITAKIIKITMKIEHQTPEVPAIDRDHEDPIKEIMTGSKGLARRTIITTVIENKT